METRASGIVAKPGAINSHAATSAPTELDQSYVNKSTLVAPPCFAVFNRFHKMDAGVRTGQKNASYKISTSDLSSIATQHAGENILSRSVTDLERIFSPACCQ